MNRGDLFRIHHPSSRDPKKSRVFVVVSRKILLESKFSTVICAPVYSKHDGLSSQVRVGINEGLKHESSIHCDELISIPKSKLTNFIGSLTEEKLFELNEALKIALDIFE
ncbi:MAG: type II toxin-antitoxin system PemK/MazF family toxin [Calditrichaceae bacterium]|nr:type II toxin-antitoxin system PemK/MazF family toxin [Calditrichaceae bacterium]